jgi:hypothetical protein
MTRIDYFLISRLLPVALNFTKFIKINVINFIFNLHVGNGIIFRQRQNFIKERIFLNTRFSTVYKKLFVSLSNQNGYLINLISKLRVRN